MKTRHSYIVALCGVMLLASCNKDNSTPQSQDNTQQSNPIERLRSFRKHIETVRTHPNQRSTETMPLTEALWDVENHFNMSYTDPEQYYEQTAKHEFHLSLPYNEAQQVLVTDAVDLYDQVVEEARQALSSDPFESKGLISLHIDQLESSDGNVSLMVEAMTGERSTYSPPTNYVAGPFTSEDNWLFASPMGKCDDPDIPSGADKQLQEKLFDELIGVLPEQNTGERNIYVNRKLFVFDGHNYAGIFLSSNGDDLCIPYHNMNQHYNREKIVILNAIPNQYHLVNYQPISIEITGIFDETDNTFTHRNEVVYGKRYRVNIEEFGEIEDILQP